MVKTKDKMKQVPKLRFSEFKKEWGIRKIGDFVEERKGIAAQDLPLYSLTIENGVVPKSKRYERSFLVKGTKDAYKEMLPGDFAFNPMNLRFGALAMHKSDFNVAVSKYYNIFYCNSEGNPKYLESYFTCYNMINYYNRMSTGTLEEKKRVHYLDFVHFKKPFPTLPEQEKIASFLSAVDKKIQQLTAKRELLEQYKKGVMQKIFSQEIRFEDENGNDYPDWEEKRLGDFVRITMGQSPDSKSYNNNAKGIFLIQGNADIVNRLTNPRQWTTEPTKSCEVGDLIFTVRAPVGSISKSIHNACIGRGVCSIKNKSNSDIEFLYQVLLDYEPKWVRLEQGSTFTAVSGNDIKSIIINLPNLPEQQNIASFLSSIDKKIESIKTQLKQTQTFKKGLLQQLFV